MSNRRERDAGDAYEHQTDYSPGSGIFVDNSYAHETRSGARGYVPVQRDDWGFDDPIQPPYSDTDQQLAEDEGEAIDTSNIMDGDRLRHAKPQTRNKYDEGPGEDDLPSEAFRDQ